MAKRVEEGGTGTAESNGERTPESSPLFGGATAGDATKAKAGASAGDGKAKAGTPPKTPAKPSPKAKAGAKKATAKAKKTKAVEKEDRKKLIPRPYPMLALKEALKVPEAIKDKNHGNPFATIAVAQACGYTNVRSTNFIYLAGASRDYGMTAGNFSTEKIELQELGKKIVFAPDPATERQAKIEALFKVDIFKKVFDHYGGSKLPEKKYLSNTLEHDFQLHPDLHDEFVKLFKDNCEYLKIENGLGEGASAAVQDALNDATEHADIRVVGQAKGKFDRTAFVVMPFSEKGIEKRPPGFFQEVLNTLITAAANEAGFAVETAEQHGSDIIQQTIMMKLLDADLVIADITDHNPNVMFELGIRMAKEKPVQLIRAEGTPRIFDVDNMLRVYSYNPNLWATTLEVDKPRMADHIKATWDNRTRNKSYMSILTGGVLAPTTAK